MTQVRRISAGLVLLGLSGALHAGGLVLATSRADPVAISGSGTPEVAAIGAAFADFVAGATPAVTVTAQAAPVAPVTALPQVPVTAEADLAVPVTAAQSVASDNMAPVRPPVTQAVPDDTAPTASLRPVARLAPPQPATPPRPAGNASVDASRGSAQGETAGQAAATGAAGTAPDQGQAAAAQYPADVLRQITRLRPPAARARGTVLISFAIAGSGDLADIGVAQSSGSAALDQMALDHIRRAAPFPPPPPGAQTAFRFEFVGRS